MNNKTKVKVCCIASLREAEMAISYGASAIGLVGPMPSGPGIIDNSLIREIASKLPSKIMTFLLTSETETKKIIEHHKITGTNTIQLVDSVSIAVYEELRNELVDINLVQVIHVVGESSISEAVECSKYVDFILLDSGNPSLQVKELGGTGRTHNWNLSSKIVEYSHVPVFLAGGLNPVNVEKAISEVRPFGVDLCSGLRTNNRLDESKLKAFMKHII